MEYNSADTVYYRQARAIQELAKNDFENLRQDSDDEEPQNQLQQQQQQQPKEAVRQRNSMNHLRLTVLLLKFQLMRSFLEEIALLSFLVLTIYKKDSSFIQIPSSRNIG